MGAKPTLPRLGNLRLSVMEIMSKWREAFCAKREVNETTRFASVAGEIAFSGVALHTMVRMTNFKIRWHNCCRKEHCTTRRKCFNPALNISEYGAIMTRVDVLH